MFPSFRIHFNLKISLQIYVLFADGRMSEISRQCFGKYADKLSFLDGKYFWCSHQRLMFVSRQSISTWSFVSNFAREYFPGSQEQNEERENGMEGKERN